jgi:hypothetical protein
MLKTHGLAKAAGKIARSSLAKKFLASQAFGYQRPLCGAGPRVYHYFQFPIFSSQRQLSTGGLPAEKKAEDAASNNLKRRMAGSHPPG